ncbi:unnamed protein product [Candida verbasci]|uniref:Complex III subunit 9 n=1 Tax=Candida verbasci TaxID=1227364 RepID=A0A9W4XHR1_9ASCO|nr:unnamed protein product [Candida verbasci]
MVLSFVGRLLERNSIYVATIFGGAFAFQGFFDSAINSWWENHNRAKLWSTVKKNLNGGDEDEDDDE